MDCKKIPLRPFPLLKLSNLSQFIESEACFDCPNHKSTLPPNFGTQNLSKLINDNLLQISSVQSLSNSTSDELNESSTVTSEMLLELSNAIRNDGLLQYPGYDSGNCALSDLLEERNTMTSEMLYDLSSAIAEGSMPDFSAFSRDSVLDFTGFCRNILPPVCPIPERLFPETVHAQRKRPSISLSSPTHNDYEMPLDYRLFEDRYETDLELDWTQHFRVIVNRRLDQNQLHVRIDEIIEVDNEEISDCTSLYPTESNVWLPMSGSSRRNSISIDIENSLNENNVFSVGNESMDIVETHSNLKKNESLENVTETSDFSKVSQIIRDPESRTSSLENFGSLPVPSNVIYVLKNIDDIQNAILKKLPSQSNKHERDKPDDSDSSSVESVLSLTEPSEMSLDLFPTGTVLNLQLGPEVSNRRQPSSENSLVQNVDKTSVENIEETLPYKGIDFCLLSQVPNEKSTATKDLFKNNPEPICENVPSKTNGIVSHTEIAPENNEAVPLERCTVIFQHTSKSQELPPGEDTEALNIHEYNEAENIPENAEAANSTIGYTLDNDYSCIGASVDDIEQISLVDGVPEQIVTLSSEKHPTKFHENYNNSRTKYTSIDTDSCVGKSSKVIIEETDVAEQTETQSSEKHPTNFHENNNNSTTDHSSTDADNCIEISTENIIEEIIAADSLTEQILTLRSENNIYSTTDHSSTGTDSCIEISTKEIEKTNAADSMVDQTITLCPENNNNSTTDRSMTGTNSCIEISTKEIEERNAAADSMTHQIVTLCSENNDNSTTNPTLDDGDGFVEASTKDIIEETGVADRMSKKKLYSSSESHPPECLGDSVIHKSQVGGKILLTELSPLELRSSRLAKHPKRCSKNLRLRVGKTKKTVLGDVFKKKSEVNPIEVEPSTSENRHNSVSQVEKMMETVSEDVSGNLSETSPEKAENFVNSIGRDDESLVSGARKTKKKVSPKSSKRPRASTSRDRVQRQDEVFKSMNQTSKKSSKGALSIDDVLNDIQKDNELRKLHDKTLKFPCPKNDQIGGTMLSPEVSGFNDRVNQMETIPDTCSGPFTGTQIFDVLTAYQLFSYETLDILYDDFKRHPETKLEERLCGMPLSSYITALNNICDLPQRHSFISTTNKVPELSFFIWKVLSVQKSVDAIKQCQKLIEYFLRHHKENAFLDLRNLIVILINMGITRHCCPFPKLFDEVSKCISSKARASKPCTEDIFRDESTVTSSKKILLRNLGYLIGTLASSLSWFSGSAKHLSDVFMIMAWLSLDLEIFKSSKGALSDCITAAIAYMPEADWQKKVESLSCSLLSMSSEHSFALHFVRLLPNTERGRRLRRCFSHCMLQRTFLKEYSFSRKVSLEAIAVLLENSNLKAIEDYHFLHNVILLLEVCIGDTFKRKHKNCLERIVNYLRALCRYIKESYNNGITVKQLVFLLHMKLKWMFENIPTKQKTVFKIM